MNLCFNKVAVDGVVKSKFFWEFIKPIMKKKVIYKKFGEDLCYRKI